MTTDERAVALSLVALVTPLSDDATVRADVPPVGLPNPTAAALDAEIVPEPVPADINEPTESAPEPSPSVDEPVTVLPPVAADDPAEHNVPAPDIAFDPHDFEKYLYTQTDSPASGTATVVSEEPDDDEDASPLPEAIPTPAQEPAPPPDLLASFDPSKYLDGTGSSSNPVIDVAPDPIPADDTHIKLTERRSPQPAPTEPGEDEHPHKPWEAGPRTVDPETARRMLRELGNLGP